MSLNTRVFIVKQPAVSPLPVKRRLYNRRGASERGRGGEVAAKREDGRRD